MRKKKRNWQNKRNSIKWRCKLRITREIRRVVLFTRRQLMGMPNERARAEFWMKNGKILAKEVK